MIFIAHRGLIRGPDKEKENTIGQIYNTLSQHYHCEIDVWLHNDVWYLGHDGPKYKIPFDFMREKSYALWIHAKNSEAFIALANAPTALNYFWHDNDDYTITSWGYGWVYPGKKVFNKSICVLPERFMKDIGEAKYMNCQGICSDYIEKIRHT